MIFGYVFLIEKKLSPAKFGGRFFYKVKKIKILIASSEMTAFFYFAAIISISHSAPNGKSLTATQLRAGLLMKYFA